MELVVAAAAAIGGLVVGGVVVRWYGSRRVTRAGEAAEQRADPLQLKQWRLQNLYQL